MIKVEVKKCEVNIEEMEGNVVGLLSQICYIAKAVCMAIYEDECDEDKKKRLIKEAVLTISEALRYGETD